MDRLRKTYNTQGEKTLDFVLGFVGWFVLNGILSVGGPLLGGLSGGLIDSLPLGADVAEVVLGAWLFLLACVPLLVNIVGLIALAGTRYWAALGALAAFALSLFVALCAAALFLASCFVILGSATP